MEELKFVNTYDPDVMLAYRGPHAADPDLEARVQQEVRSLQDVLVECSFMGNNPLMVGNGVMFKDTRLQVMLYVEDVEYATPTTPTRRDVVYPCIG